MCNNNNNSNQGQQNQPCGYYIRLMILETIVGMSNHRQFDSQTIADDLRMGRGMVIDEHIIQMALSIFDRKGFIDWNGVGNGRKIYTRVSSGSGS